MFPNHKITQNYSIFDDFSQVFEIHTFRYATAAKFAITLCCVDHNRPFL